MVLTGIDGTANTLDAIRSGTMDGTVSQPLTSYVDATLDMIKARGVGGETFKTGPAEFGCIQGKFVKGAAGPHFQMPPIVVTKDNVDDPKLWANLKS